MGAKEKGGHRMLAIRGIYTGKDIQLLEEEVAL